MSEVTIEQLKADLEYIFDSASLGSFTVEPRANGFLVSVQVGKYVPKVVLENIESKGYSFMTVQAMIESEKTFLGITIGGKKK